MLFQGTRFTGSRIPFISLEHVLEFAVAALLLAIADPRTTDWLGYTATPDATLQLHIQVLVGGRRLVIISDCEDRRCAERNKQRSLLLKKKWKMKGANRREYFTYYRTHWLPNIESRKNLFLILKLAPSLKIRIYIYIYIYCVHTHLHTYYSLLIFDFKERTVVISALIIIG